MIINNHAVAPTMSNVGQTSQATIKASARLFNFFSDMIYGDKFVAIWRELVANGVDSHKASGNTDKSVVVTLPTAFTPYAKVRDYGTGMSRDFLMGKFMAYTDASTKENSNDYIGGFGIGSKAPLSYTEQFAIHSYQKGTLSVYSVFKDADDCPSIAFLSEGPTDEPDGIEISFPVEQGDINRFKEAALKCLTYFDPLPELRNCTEQLKAPEYTVRGDTWAFRSGTTTSQIVQGGVAYPIDTNSVPRQLHDILGFGIDFFVPIGSVGIALSRESLSYNDATIRVLTSLCETIRPKIKEHVDAMFANQPSKWEATRAYYKAVQVGTAASRMIESLAYYKGEKLQRYVQPVMADKVLATFVTNNRWGKGGSNVWTTGRSNPKLMAWTGQIMPSTIDHIIIIDTDNKPILRVRNFLENMVRLEDGVMVVRKRPDAPDRVDPLTKKPDPFINDLDWNKWIEAMGSPKVTFASTVEPAVVVRGPSVKRVEKVRGYKHPSPKAPFIDELPAGGGFYVEMEAWALKYITSEQISATDFGDKPVYYFNKGDIDKVKADPEWKPAKSKFDEQVAAYKATHKNAKLAMAFAGLGGSFHNSTETRLVSLLSLAGFECPKRGPMAKLATLHSMAKPDLTDKDRKMRAFCGMKIEDAAKQLQMLKGLVAEIKTKYPELETLLRVGGYTNTQLVSVYNRLVS